MRRGNLWEVKAAAESGSREHQSIPCVSKSATAANLGFNTCLPCAKHQ